MSNIPLMNTASNATSTLQKQEVNLVQNEIKSLGKSGLSDAEKAKKLREQCEGFESIFIQKMWQQMRATLPQENPLVGREEKFWQSMYDTELSKKMTEGGGIGLADMMYEQLSKNLVSASRTTATNAANAGGSGFALNNNDAQKVGIASPTKAFSIEPAAFMPSPLANLDKKSESLPKEDLLAEKPVKSQPVDASLYENITVPPVAPQAVAPSVQASTVAPVPMQMKSQIMSGKDGNDNSALRQFISGVQAQAESKAQNASQNANNSSVVQQYLTGLQQKNQMNVGAAAQVAPQAAPVIANPAQTIAHMQASMTGPERAQLAQRLASTNLPAQGVMPPMQSAMNVANNVANNANNNGAPSPIKRTTYTTNIPKNERRGDTEKLVREALMQKINANANSTAMSQAVPQQPMPMNVPQASHVQPAPQAHQAVSANTQAAKAQVVNAHTVGAPIVPSMPYVPATPAVPNQPYVPATSQLDAAVAQPEAPTVQAAPPVRSIFGGNAAQTSTGNQGQPRGEREETLQSLGTHFVPPRPIMPQKQDV